MHEEINVKDNYYNLSAKNLKCINYVVNWFFGKVQSMIISDKITSDFDVKGLIILIAEFYDYFNDQNKWLEHLYVLYNKIKKDIENNFLSGSSLFGGVTGAAVATHIVVHHTGHYKKLLDTMNGLVKSDTIKYINFATKNIADLHAKHYDTISGLAGTGNYLLLNPANNADTLIKICDYFCLLVNSYADGQTLVPRWFIKKENIAGIDTYKYYDKGCINFSLSHGIAGPLVVLSKVQAMCNADGKDLSIPIKQLLSLYEEWEFPNDYDVLQWPGQLRIESFISKQYCEALNNRRCSWCYGSIGITHALLTASISISDYQSVGKYINNLEKICREPLNNHFFSSSQICHGLAGELAILNKWNRVIKSKIIKTRIEQLTEVILSNFNSNYTYGFRNYEFDSNVGEHIYSDDMSFLEGTAGIVLTLLSTLRADSSLFENHLML